MSRTISPSTQRPYGLQRVCKAWDIARSTVYRNIIWDRQKSQKKRGPKPKVDDQALEDKIRQDINDSPFNGEGHRKVHARLKRRGVKVGRNRVLRMMRDKHLLSPHRGHYRPPNPHDGQITTSAPNIMWGSDGTKLLTADDGWVWIFTVADHWNAECLGWHVCKVGDRFAALEPISQAVKGVYGSLMRGVASGLKLRIDNGSQYTSDYFLKQVKYMGIESSFGLVRQPETNGVAERFHRTLKDHIVGARVFKNIEEVREAVDVFVRLYNSEWLVGKLGYRSPSEARRDHVAPSVGEREKGSAA